MTVTIPDAIGERLCKQAANRNTTPEKLLVNYIDQCLPAIVIETLVCCHCGKEFKAHKNKKLFCSYDCYRSAPFPRLGVGMMDIQQYYGCDDTTAAEALSVSVVQLRRVIKKFGLKDRFVRKSRGV